MHLEIKLGHAIEMSRHQPKKAMLKSSPSFFESFSGRCLIDKLGDFNPALFLITYSTTYVFFLHFLIN